jgi:hypothetical protein
MAAAALHSPTKMAERIAALVHATPITGLHTARILRTANAKGRRLDLWPQTGSGVRIASFKRSQPMNLLLALADGNPIRGPETVAGFRSLPRGTEVETLVRDTWNALSPAGGSQRTITKFEVRETSLLPGGTFGEGLDFFMETLASPEDKRREYLRLATVILTLAPYRAAKILIPRGEGVTYQIDYPGKRTPAPSALYRVLEGSTDETMGPMEALAIMWRANQAALRPATKKTAATHPLPGTGATAPSQPSATTREPGRPTPPVLSEREIALNRYTAGLPFIEERPHARRKQLSADPAGG